MPKGYADAVIGLQWGDEGKGKIVDFLTESHDVVVRFQGGANAGHTIVIDGKTYVLHYLPSGVLRPGKENILGNGMVIDLKELAKEMRELANKGVSYNLYISNRAHVTLPYHKSLEQLDAKIGTTGRGIGPTYATKVGRTGIRMCDFDDYASLKEQVCENLERFAPLFDKLGGKFDVDKIVEEQIESLKVVKEYARIEDTAELLNDWLANGRHILLEGAQGSLLDVDDGTYPFVTSSNTTIGGACTGSGLPTQAIKNVIGVLKAYATRVGEGPHPTEIHGRLGQTIRECGGEYGATTGRPRRCGWLDLVAARYSAMINGVNSIALTKADVLDGIDPVLICDGYGYNGECMSRFPASARVLEKCEPSYVRVAGWDNTKGATSYEQLDDSLKAYIDLIGRNIAPVSMISTGAARESVIIRHPELVM